MTSQSDQPSGHERGGADAPLPAEMRLLILEEATGAQPAISALQEAKVRFTSKLVDTEAAFHRELDDFAPNLVLAASAPPA